MANPRKSGTDNQDMYLYEEVEGVCPKCTDPLMYEKNRQMRKQFQKAHIYPLNPTKDELIILNGVEKLSSDVNHLDNLIALCSKCHGQFDNPRTLEGYLEMLELKSRLIRETKSKNVWGDFSLEVEIRLVIESIAFDESLDYEEEIEYDPIAIDAKTDDTISPLTKRKIKGDVTQYFSIVKQKLKEVDSLKQSASDIISSQVKTYYLKMKSIHSDQQSIYEEMIRWLHKKTNSKSYDASSIVVSFFIQNCEVLS